ncbi:MAG: hypothetical protein ACFFC1_17585, partial [Promethearchaeota archaeon]
LIWFCLFLMMKRFIKYLKNWKKSNSDINEDEYHISQGCCFFHNRSELSNFTDIKDDNIEE